MNRLRRAVWGERCVIGRGNHQPWSRIVRNSQSFKEGWLFSYQADASFRRELSFISL
jgi:hypothetical protein